MHVLVATDGQIDPDLATRFVAPLAGPDGDVTVLTVVEIPRRLLHDLRQVFGESPDALVRMDVETVSSVGQTPPPMSWPGDDAIINRYLDDKRTDRCGPIVDALTAAGIKATSKVTEGDATGGILTEARESAADLIVIGSHGQGRFEGLLGSTGTKIARLAGRPVLLLRSAR